MSLAEAVPDEPKTHIVRIGVITEPLGTQDTPLLRALRFLILHLNTLQQSFEFELLPGPPDDPLLTLLASKEMIKLNAAREKMKEFVERIMGVIERQNIAVKEFFRQEIPLEPPPSKFVILTVAQFDGHFYSTRMPDKDPTCAIIALGDWERSMAPPTIVEFFLTLLLRQAVALASPSLSGSVHLGTKGCLYDFDRNLRDTRYKVLNGFVCDHCAKALIKDGYPALKQELVKILAKEWLGSPDEPSSAASIASTLGHNLFIIKGMRPTLWETVRSFLHQEVIKQSLTFIGLLLAAVAFYLLGLKSPNP